MSPDAAKALATETAAIVKRHVDAAVAPLLTRIDALEKIQPLPGDPGEKGEKGDPGADGRDGLSIKGLLVDRAGHLRCVMTDGTDYDLGGVVGSDGKDGQPGKDGRDGEAGRGLTEATVTRDGTLLVTFSDGTKQDLGRIVGRDGVDGKDGEAGRDGESGVGMAGAMITRDGALVVTLSDGTTAELGPVVGRDGAPGKDGQKGDPGQDGKDGAPGRSIEVVRLDGDDLVVRFSDEEEVALGPVRGPAGKDGNSGAVRGTYSADAEYRALDLVSYGGSEWRAKRDDPGPLPGDGWQLSASKGQRGEKGERGQPGMKGEKGEDGVGICAGHLDVEARQLVLIRDDGQEFAVDLAPLFLITVDGTTD